MKKLASVFFLFSFLIAVPLTAETLPEWEGIYAKTRSDKLVELHEYRLTNEKLKFQIDPFSPFADYAYMRFDLENLVSAPLLKETDTTSIISNFRDEKIEFLYFIVAAGDYVKHPRIPSVKALRGTTGWHSVYLLANWGWNIADAPKRNLDTFNTEYKVDTAWFGRNLTANDTNGNPSVRTVYGLAFWTSSGRVFLVHTPFTLENLRNTEALLGTSKRYLDRMDSKTSTTSSGLSFGEAAD